MLTYVPVLLILVYNIYSFRFVHCEGSLNIYQVLLLDRDLHVHCNFTTRPKPLSSGSRNIRYARSRFDRETTRRTLMAVMSTFLTKGGRRIHCHCLTIGWPKSPNVDTCPHWHPSRLFNGFLYSVATSHYRADEAKPAHMMLVSLGHMPAIQNFVNRSIRELPKAPPKRQEDRRELS